MKTFTDNWTLLKGPGVMEVDFHHDGKRDHDLSYEEAMEQVREKALSALKTAQLEGYEFVLFTHGLSTSRPGTSTARSEIRGLMRSKDATPYIVRKNCIQHESVFRAAIKKPE